jgi:integrase
MYSVTMRHVLRYCQASGLPQPYTHTVDGPFIEGFIHYLRTVCRHMQNTIRAHVERLHVILSKAAQAGYPVNSISQKLNVPEEEVDAIYLSMDEITSLFLLTNLTRSQTEIRDTFIIGCLTGLRYSDYSRLTQKNFIHDFRQIKIKTRKTGTVVQLPAHRIVREILERYDYRLPGRRCIQYFNAAIKQICKKAGINDRHLYERTVGSDTVRKTCEKWELVSSHTARRSFATNMFISGIPPFRIMLITGHRSEKSFFKYIRITREENASVLSGHPFFL